MESKQSARSRTTSASMKPLPITTKKPSDRLNLKTIDPFSQSNKSQSVFASVYSNGGIPCRLVHGSVNHRLQWNVLPEQVPLDPVLVLLAEGIRETVHPYTFVARVGFKELLQVTGHSSQIVSLLPRIAPPLRAALGSNDLSVCEAGIEALSQLTLVVGSALNYHIKSLIGPLCKRIVDKKLKEPILLVLQLLEQKGGKDALLIIKSKVPTYSSINM